MVNIIGMVFAMTNSAEDNQIVAFARNRDGTLTRMGTYKTGGQGTGAQKVDPLSSQGSIIISSDGRMLYAVNAGSNSISSFSITNDGELILTSMVASNGVMPNSLAVHGNLLYVSNKGNANNQIGSNVSGFRLMQDGTLTPIPEAKYSLSSFDAASACIVFNKAGTILSVSELSTNKISVFPVNVDGTLAKATVNNSAGTGPFGSVFLSNGVLLVTEAGANALSSYTSMKNGNLSVISRSVANNQSATCWVSANSNEQFAFTSNAGSNTISVYRISQNGALMLKQNVVVDPNSTAAPIDNATSRDGNNLYVLNGNGGTISVFHILNIGEITLTQVYKDTGLPMMGIQGIAAL